jgi:hypothetical protein
MSGLSLLFVAILLVVNVIGSLQDGEYAIILKHALQNNQTACDLQLHFQVRNQTVLPALVATSLFFNSSPASTSFNAQISTGIIECGGQTNALNCYANLHINSDPFVVGGDGQYNFSITPNPVGQLLHNVKLGSYTGTYTSLAGLPYSRADDVTNAFLWPVWRSPWPRQQSNDAPHYDHPRLLFRSQDVPALQTRARSTTGQAMIKVLKDKLDDGNFYIESAAVYCFLWQIEQNKSHAVEAAKVAMASVQGRPDADDRCMSDRTSGFHAISTFLLQILSTLPTSCD